MTTTQKVLLAAGAVIVAAGVLLKTPTPAPTAPTTPQSVNTPMPVPYPGFWRPGAGGYFYPCNVIPYLQFQQPDTGKDTYVRYDYQVMAYTTDPTRLNQPAGQGGAGHIYQYTANDGRLVPISQQVQNPGHFPPPTIIMLNPNWSPGDPAYQDAGQYWITKNPGVSANPVLEAVYSARIANTTEWISGNTPAFQVQKQQQCSAPPQPTKTPTPVPVTAVPTQTPTTCVPRIITVVVTATKTPSFSPAPTKLAWNVCEHGHRTYADGSSWNLPGCPCRPGLNCDTYPAPTKVSDLYPCDSWLYLNNIDKFPCTPSAAKP